MKTVYRFYCGNYPLTFSLNEVVVTNHLVQAPTFRAPDMLMVAPHALHWEPQGPSGKALCWGDVESRLKGYDRACCPAYT